jgi:hypothetical protein
VAGLQGGPAAQERATQEEETARRDEIARNVLTGRR